MIRGSRRSRQPVREVWTRERLVHERAVALGNVIDKSTLSNYSSALNLYLNFVRLHDFPVEPTPETLSFYTVYMSHHINPRSVNTYLSGISQQLETYFPAVKEARNSLLVRRTYQGCMRMKGRATTRKQALTATDIHLVLDHYRNTTVHDDLLFIAMLLTGFFGLLRLCEMTFPDDPVLHNYKKVTRRSTVRLQVTLYEFTLPGHKADRFFEGNKSLSLHNASLFTPSVTSPHISAPGTQFIQLLPLSGSQKLEKSLPARSSLPGCASSLRRTLLASP